MRKLKKIATEARRVLRFLATGDTVSKRNRRALDDYRQYQARERGGDPGQRGG